MSNMDTPPQSEGKGLDDVNIGSLFRSPFKAPPTGPVRSEPSVWSLRGPTTGYVLRGTSSAEEKPATELGRCEDGFTAGPPHTGDYPKSDAY